MRAIAATLLLVPLVFSNDARADAREQAAPAGAPGSPADERPATGATAAPASPARGPRIEVAFVLDATGSMSPYIEEARHRIADIASDLATGEPRPAVRYALVAYRDRGDAFVTRIERFSPQVEVMRRRLDATGAEGGGDHPEAVLEGLHAAITRLAWSDRDPEALKLIYLVGDAPPQHYPGAPDEHAVAAAARERGIVIHTIACGGMNAPGVHAFDTLARLTEGRAMALRDAGTGRAVARGRRDDGGFASAVSGTAQAYSASVGVDYRRDRAAPVTTALVPAPAMARSGLLGAHVRWIRDPIAWSDLWAAHVSAVPERERPPVPAVDFATHHVLVVGGADAGLILDGMTISDGVRAANVRPGDGVQLVLVPVARERGESR